VSESANMYPTPSQVPSQDQMRTWRHSGYPRNPLVTQASRYPQVHPTFSEHLLEDKGGVAKNLDRLRALNGRLEASVYQDRGRQVFSRRLHGPRPFMGGYVWWSEEE
jgi:hypothetical protein